MDRFKKFFEKKAGKKSFKNCGVGHRLSDEPPSKMPIANVGKMQKETNESPSVQRITTADIAAQAAFKRMNLGSRQESSTQRAIRLQALRELEKERDLQEQSITGSKHECEVREFEHCNMLEEIYFTCDLLGSDKKFTESEMKRSLESFLRSQLRSDGIVASVLILFSLNATDKRQQAVETLKKYVTNVMENPSVAKYRRIRLDNHIFQERVAPVKGSRDFLEACGFEECSEVVTEGDEPRKFLVISEEKANDASKLLDALEALNEGQPVPLKLHRNPVIYLLDPGQPIPKPKLSDRFFDVDSEELKREQIERSECVEKLTSLRTQEMRKRDKILSRYRYKYTLIRIRFPDGHVLEGTFGCHEPFSAVMEFVEGYVFKIEPCLFSLRDHVTSSDFSDLSKTLHNLNLVPAAVLYFSWDPESFELAKEGSKIRYLQEIYETEAKCLTNK